MLLRQGQHPAGQVLQKIFPGRGHGQRQQEPGRRRAHRRQITEIDRERAMPE
jgi:hypothetical protein